MVPETISIDDVYDDIQDVYIYTNGGLTEEQYESFRSMFPNAVITYKWIEDECFDYFCERIDAFPSLEYIYILPIPSTNADDQELIKTSN